MTGEDLMIIGLGGYAKVGKDEFAKVADLYGFKNMGSFSVGVHEALCELDPWIIFDDGRPPMRYTDLFATMGYHYEAFKEVPEVRRLLQKMGTEVGRGFFGEGCWIKVKYQAMGPYMARGYTKFIVTGVRYENEMDWVNHHHGVSIWIERPGYGPVNSHSSDNTLGPDDFDHIIVNDGTLEDLRLKVSRFLSTTRLPLSRAERAAVR